MPFQDANLRDLLGCERRYLITLESHSIHNEKKWNLSRVRRNRGCEAAGCGLGREGALGRACGGGGDESECERQTTDFHNFPEGCILPQL
jgi:hypothetical protein